MRSVINTETQTIGVAECVLIFIRNESPFIADMSPLTVQLSVY